jgi:hypothetical protein
LPRPFQQGCLWGLLQGILSAALLLLAMNDSAFYWGIAEGLLFYLLAGFLTTRRGGRVTRSLRTGFWAGIFSTIFYWIAILLGLLIKALPLVQRIVNESGATPGEALRRAIARVTPPILSANAASGSGQGLRSTLILVALGLACAMGCALVGGLLGARYADRS